MKFDPNSIPLRNTSQEFEYEKISREIDRCNDVKELQNMCKFLLKLEMKTRETYSIMIADTIEAMNIDLPQENL